MERTAIIPLLLNAPFIVTERVNAKTDHVNARDEDVMSTCVTIKRTDPMNVTWALRFTRTHESVIFINSRFVGPQSTFPSRRSALNCNSNDGGAYSKIEIHHDLNTEYMQY